MRIALVVVVIATIFGLRFWPTNTNAQSPNEFQVAIPVSLLNNPLTIPGVPNAGAAMNTITARANGQTCVTAPTTDTSTEVVLRLGLSGQPAACSEDGNEVTFVLASGTTLASTFPLKKGTRVELTNLGPRPPGTGDSSSGAGAFGVIVPLESLNSRPPGIAPQTIAERLGALTALADGVPCETLVLVGLSADGRMNLGQSSQPAECQREGARVTFAGADGQVLVQSTILRKGTTERLVGLAPSTSNPSVGFDVVIPAAILNEGVDRGESAGERYRTITALANDHACTSADVRRPADNIVLTLGFENQPSACRTEGAVVTFQIENGRRLVQQTTLHNGGTYILQRLGIQPPSDPGPQSGNAGRSSSPTSTPVTSRFTPPDTGDGGLR